MSRGGAAQPGGPWWLAAGLLGALAGGCGEPAATDRPGLPVARPAAHQAGPSRSTAVPLTETFLLVKGRPDSVSSAVPVEEITLPDEPRYKVPQVRLPSAAATQRLNATLLRLLLTGNLNDTTPAASAQQAIRRARADYLANGQIGVFATDYEVQLNQAGLLSIALQVEYSGAYPWAATQHATFEVNTGRRLSLADLLTDTLTLRRRWHQRLNARLLAHRRQIARDFKGDADAWATVRDYTGWSDTLQQLRPAMRPRLGEFALTPQGLLLYTRFEFPHAVLSLSPADDYFFSYAELKTGRIIHNWCIQMQ